MPGFQAGGALSGHLVFPVLVKWQTGQKEVGGWVQGSHL